MTFAFDALALLKLLFGIAAFVAIGWIGTRSKRVAGVLLTFPILNGIAMLVDPQPLKVADAIAPLAMFNSALFALVVSFIDWTPPLPARLSETVKLAVRLIVWMALWFCLAFLLTDYRGQLPSQPVLFVVQACVAAVYVWCLWRAPPVPKPRVAPAPAAFYRGWAIRLSFFVVAFCVLLFTAQNAPNPKWVGMASALPLPGLFAVAYLSTHGDRHDLRPIRDTVLLGPLLVIPFNLLFATWISDVSKGPFGTAIGIAGLLVAWGTGLALVFWLVPRLERHLDRRNMPLSA